MNVDDLVIDSWIKNKLYGFIRRKFEERYCWNGNDNFMIHHANTANVCFKPLNIFVVRGEVSKQSSH